MKKLWVVSILAVAAISAVWFRTPLMLYGQSGFALDRPENVIAYVNDSPVEVEEFMLFARLTGEQTGDVGGEEILKEKIMSNLVRAKVLQQEAIRYRIWKDNSYTAFLKELEIQNQRRMRALDNNEVIYGPKQYTAQMYYDYRQSVLYNALQSIWAGQHSKPTEKSLAAFYEENREQLGKKHDSMTLYKIVEPFTNSEPGKREESRLTAQKRIQQASIQLTNGSAFIKVFDNYKSRGGLAVIETIHDANYKDISKYRSWYYSQVTGLQEGETSGVFEEGESFAIVFCASRNTGGYRTFEEVREEVMRRYTKQGFENYILELASKAKVRPTKIFDGNLFS